MSSLTHSHARTAPARRTGAVRAGEVLAEVEAERAALGRLLHDDVLQSLIAARYAADLAGAPQVAEALREAVAEAKKPAAADAYTRDRLADMLQFFELMTSWCEQTRKLPTAAVIRMVKMGSKLGRLLESKGA